MRLVSSQQRRKVLVAYAVTIGEDVSAIHPAAKVTVCSPVSLKLLRSVASDESWSRFCKRDQIAGFARMYAADLELKSSTLLQSRLLYQSGKEGVCINLPKSVEGELGTEPAFCNTDDAATTWAKLREVDGCGLTGPTRRRLRVLRTTTAALPQARCILLGEGSQFAADWSLQVTHHKFAGRFPAQLSSEAVCQSLKQSLAWSCVVLARQPAVKGFVTLTLGAASAPLFSELIILDSAMVLKEIQRSADVLPATFVKPRVATVRELKPSVSLTKHCVKTGHWLLKLNLWLGFDDVRIGHLRFSHLKLVLEELTALPSTGVMLLRGMLSLGMILLLKLGSSTDVGWLSGGPKRRMRQWSQEHEYERLIERIPPCYGCP